MALKDAELRDWLENLAQTNRRRRDIIYDLLKHKAVDAMSEEDYQDCQRALQILRDEAVPERPGPRQVPQALVEVEQEH